MRTLMKGDQVLLLNNFSNVVFLYKINFASAGNLETIRSFSPFSSLIDIDVLIGLFCYFHLLSLQTVYYVYFSNFLNVNVQLVSQEPFSKHVQEVNYMLFMINVLYFLLNLFLLL